jgi:hypothetical protein
MWAVKPHLLTAIAKPPGGAEVMRRIDAPMDSVDEGSVACDPTSGTVYFTALWDPYLRELSVRDRQVRRHTRPYTRDQRGGFLVFRPSDGRIVLTDKYDLILYAPDRMEVLQRLPAAVLSVGLDLCPTDGAVAVADVTGRVRLFRQAADGTYAFDWAVSVFAPRLVKFSPDCRFLAVTSLGEEKVFLVDRAQRAVVRTFSVGPFTRGVAFFGPHELAVADACTLTVLDF